jgi:hypothetical protein
MGVLDDAIREHLELKRQHGVAEEELQRQEEEALGPARRDVAPAESAEDEAAAEPELHDQETMLQEPEPAPEEEQEPEPEEEPEPEPAPSVQTEESPAVAAPFDGMADASAPEPEAGGTVSEEIAAPEAADEHAAEELVPEPAAEHAAEDSAAEPDAPFARDEVVEPDLGDEPPREPAEDTLPSGFDPVEDDELIADEELEEDLLEDTPDFLQETPEHDRLWFEQKPPRDFDFD